MHTVYEVETPEGSYVGVTGRSIDRRLIELRSRRGFKGAIRAVAVFEDKAEALALERRLRPDYEIGLNIAKGGERSGGGLQRFGAMNSSAKRVRVRGVEYSTITEAARTHGVKMTTACYRVTSPFFSDWERML